ncbi:MAG: hypothetical protein ACOYWZ_23325 [Bacillota bacterium]
MKSILSLTEEKLKYRKFLEAFYAPETYGNAREACEAADISYETFHKSWLKNPAFVKELREFDAGVRKLLYPKVARLLNRAIERGSIDGARLFYKLEKLLDDTADVNVEGDIKMIVELDDGQKIKAESEGLLNKEKEEIDA